MISICVIDGQGGGIGGTIIKRLKEEFGEAIKVIAIGTNAIATSQMLKSGANKGATGENAIAVTVHDVDFLIGPVSILIADAMMGEVTKRMAIEIGRAKVRKFILPLTQEEIFIIGVKREPLPHLVDMLIEELKKDMEI